MAVLDPRLADPTLLRLAGLRLQRRRRPALDAVSLMRQAGMEPDPWQEQVIQSQSDHIILNCCRQSGKSTLTAALTLATAFQEPGALILVLSPSLRQSQESFRKVLDLYSAC